MNQKYSISTSPHIRTPLTTSKVMLDVILALVPVTVVGIWNHGYHAALVLAMSVITAVLAEFVFDFITGKPNTITDGSAVVTGLLLGLTLPPAVPLYVPCLGSIFAIVVAKGLFGGIGKNLVNPALAGRCFLLISFGTAMTNYTIDGVSSATPLTDPNNFSTMMNSFTGAGSGIIGNSAIAIIIGGLFLWAVGGITIEIPLVSIVSFTLFVGIFGEGFNPTYLLSQLMGGGMLLGGIFMATDPVTSPVTHRGELVYGLLFGILSGIFRVVGSATDSVSYAIMLANVAAPVMDEITIPKPYGHKGRAAEPKADKAAETKEVKSAEPEKNPEPAKGEQPKDGGAKKRSISPKPAIVLCVITLLAGAILGVVYQVTKEPIAQIALEANIASYQAVSPNASSFSERDDITAKIEEIGESYGTDYGRVNINDAVFGDDGSCVISVTTKDGYEGDITLSVGIMSDGTVNAIAFTEINETGGMGSKAADEPFKSQFNGVKTDKFILNKVGGSTADNEIDSVSGASTTSGAVVNAVNAALDFWTNYVKEGA